MEVVRKDTRKETNKLDPGESNKRKQGIRRNV